MPVPRACFLFFLNCYSSPVSLAACAGTQLQNKQPPVVFLTLSPHVCCPSGGRFTLFAGVGMGAVPEQPPTLHILLTATQLRYPLNKNNSKKPSFLNCGDTGDFKMLPHTCTDLLSVAEVFSTIFHFPLLLILVAPAPCITLKICPYVSSKIYQLGLLTQSNVYCFQHCRANIAEQQVISTSCSIIKIAS